MAKYIHYCWFGGKPLSNLAKKCLKSWKIYLPDFKIIRWDETNCDINECQFVKQAYDNKKWAFVADYFRSKALKEYGGIYFDTDMEITKPIDELLKSESFLGVEDSDNIAVGVWWEKNKNAFLPTYLYNFYNKQTTFDLNEMFSFSIPKLVTNELEKYGYDKYNVNYTQTIKNVTIYPREYFYPLSYDRQNNIFTEKTCMIHYYDATWVPNWEKRQIKLIRILGREKATKIINISGKIKQYIKKLIKLVLFPYIIYRRKKHEKTYFLTRKENLNKKLLEVKNNDVIAIHHENWLGTKFATKELFNNTLALPELYHKDNFNYFANKILEKKPKLIIFSAFAIGWYELINEINNIDNSLPIKILWHGSNAVHTETYDFEMFKKIFELLNSKKIESIGFVKKSMYLLYKKLGYNVEFVDNTIKLDKKIIDRTVEKTTDKIKIGLYASGDRWVKNFYNQLAGASLVDNCEIDIIPLSKKTREFSKILKCKISGVESNISRDEMLNRMAKNDINIYATFVDCAPLTPLESLELGVPCITGNNHHYWENTELEKYLVVDKVDNSIEIYEKIELCLKNKDKIINLYKEWKKKQDKYSEESVKKFIKIK